MSYYTAGELFCCNILLARGTQICILQSRYLAHHMILILSYYYDQHCTANHPPFGSSSKVNVHGGWFAILFQTLMVLLVNLPFQRIPSPTLLQSYQKQFLNDKENKVKNPGNTISKIIFEVLLFDYQLMVNTIIQIVFVSIF